ncbi:hypothetical protein [Streptomyces sp. NPDC048202]|uniref:hypothetical protein n=1 Tax=Streptomyces sp. NPDC048202 TaxID=3365514 RepID=UPI00371A9149
MADDSTSLTPPSEKVDFGNEVDFYGDPVLGLTQVGFRVFQTGENVTYGGEAACTQAAPCTFAQVKVSLNDGGAAPLIYTAAVGKGRDYLWAGAVDGLRINRNIYDFEADGVRVRRA